MARPLPPLNALRAFEAAGRHESFSRAADELGVSHSAISRHVRGLEDRLGTQLFRDRSRGVALSPQGAAYLAQVTPALDAIAQATERLAERPAGAVLVNAEPLLATRWLIPRLQEFHDSYPDIEVRLEVSDGLADLARYEADLAIRFLTVPGSEPDGILLSDAPLYPCARPGLVDVTLPLSARFARQRLLRDRSRDTWALWCARAGIAPLTGGQPDGWRLRAALAHASALAGQGVLLTSAEITSQDVAEGRLAQVSTIGIRQGRYAVLLGEGARRRAAVRRFADWLLDTAAPFRGQAAADTQPPG